MEITGGDSRRGGEEEEIAGSVPCTVAWRQGDCRFGSCLGPVGSQVGLPVWSMHVLPVLTRVSYAKNPNKNMHRTELVLLLRNIENGEGTDSVVSL